MNLDDEVAELSGLMEEKGKKHLAPGCVWATVKDVNWEEKTMTAIGVEDELDFFEVQLGLGSYYRKPVVDTLVMLGVPGLQDRDCFLIECEEFDEAIWVSGETTHVIKKEGFVVQQGDENLVTILSDWQEQFGKLCDEVTKIVVSVGTTPNVPAILAIKQEVIQGNNSRLKQVLKEN